MSSLFKSLKRNLLVDKIDRHLAKKSFVDVEQRALLLAREKSFHPSQMDACLRAMFYMWCAIPGTSDVPKPKTVRIFDEGDHVHIRYQTYLRDMGRLWGDWKCTTCKKKWTGLAGHAPCKHANSKQEYKEYVLCDMEFGIWGRCDGIVFPDEIPDEPLRTYDEMMRTPERKTVLELKSMNSHNFSKLRTPPDHYLTQVNAYMNCLGIKETTFIFENKDTQDNKQFVEPIDYKIVKWFKDRIRKFHKYWKAKKLPPKENCDPKWCAFRDECLIKKHDVKFLLDNRKKVLEGQKDATKKITKATKAKKPVRKNRKVDSNQGNKLTAKAKLQRLRAKVSKGSVNTH